MPQTVRASEDCAGSTDPHGFLTFSDGFRFTHGTLCWERDVRLNQGYNLAAALIIVAAALSFSGAAYAQSPDSNFYYERGVTNRAQGNTDQAFSDFNEAIRSDPRNSNAYVGRGSVRFDNGSMADYDEAIRIDPNNEEAYSRRAFLHNMQMNYEAALSNYNQALRINPIQAETLGQRAAVHQRLGNNAQALMDYNESIRLDPRDARAWFDRGLFHRRAGNLAQAEADFARALRLDPSLRHYYQNMR